MPEEEYEFQEEAEYTELYKKWIVVQLQEMSELARDLRTSYLNGEEDRETHFELISLCCELWMQLLPKMTNTSIFDKYKKWSVIYSEPRILLVDRFSPLIFEFTFIIRMGAEHLGISRISGGL